MRAVRRGFCIDLLAYVVMPEHVHLLLHPRAEDYEMRRILAALKRPVADAAKSHLLDTGNTSWLRKLTVSYPSRQVFRFWQPGGGSRESVRVALLCEQCGSRDSVRMALFLERLSESSGARRPDVSLSGSSTGCSVRNLSLAFGAH
jgi:hypothetical protein